VEIATPEMLQRVEDIIRAERRVTVDAVATIIGCSRGLTMMRLKEQCARGSDSNQRILRRRFPGTCETVGQVFKFVWRFC